MKLYNSLAVITFLGLFMPNDEELLIRGFGLSFDFMYTLTAACHIEKSLPHSKATKPPHKWVDNTELSVPDQMTNITEKTRPQSLFTIEPKAKGKHTRSVQLVGFIACIRIGWGLLNISQANKCTQTVTCNTGWVMLKRGLE